LNIRIAKNAGFCFGVSNALKVVEKLIEEGYNVCTLGKIIHNSQVVESLNKRGVKVVHSFFDVSKNSVVVIRSHGTTSKVLEDAKKSGINFVDATCPFVKKIHRIVKEHSDDKDFLLLAGDFLHPEVVGIRSYFKGRSYVFSSLEELKSIFRNNSFEEQKGIMVSQTTFSVRKWEECVEFILKGFTNIEICDTICNITSLRQSETEKLAKTSDFMIIVGGKESSNTRKLYDLCLSYTRAVHIESLEDLKRLNLKNYTNIGITAGASTPLDVIEEIKNYLERPVQQKKD